MEITLELKVVLIHVAIGAIIGVISSYLSTNFTAVLMAIVVLLAMRTITKQVTLKAKETDSDKTPTYDTKWWLSNGLYPYVVFWLLIWILFYNL